TGHFRPAIDGHLAILGIQSDDDLARKGNAGVVEETGRLYRRSADDDVGNAVIEAAADRVEIADAAAQLDRDLLADLFEDRLDRRLVLRLAGESAVQVHEMQAARALVDPMTRHRRRL